MGEHSAKIILVMGITGAGKSYLIREISGQDIRVGDDLKSCTQHIEAVTCQIAGQSVMILDTPGFDDTHRSDTEILTEVADHLANLHRNGFQVCGIVYLHSIREDRVRGSSYKNLKMFEKLCGEDALQNVVMLTNRWGQIDELEAVRREDELKAEYWNMYLAAGCTIDRYRDRNDLVRIFEALLQQNPTVLDIQSEIVDGHKSMSETSAGALLQVNTEMDQAHAQFELNLQLQATEYEATKAVHEQQLEGARQELQKALDRPTEPTPPRAVLLYDASRQLFVKICNNQLWGRGLVDPEWQIILRNPSGNWEGNSFIHQHGYICHINGQQWEEVQPHFHTTFEEMV
ncbi:hypothetical protein EMPS_10763 [Entomortierella parvispora]|uniref:G domain-containing protein n=1 Tax=Entomortierella parvispora TaxID=205924 RepID=A0A9P3HKI6_9FUNG|nr:hypothetical protein EMPS_10763 [Entomortierella parvispora]